MSAIPYDDTPTRDPEPEPEADAIPGRPRRRWWGRKTAALAAAILCAATFYAGIRVEKGQLSTATTTPTAVASSAGAGHAGFAGGAPGGSGASIGTVSSVDGNTIYLTDTSGDTVKVTLSSATKITKSESTSKTSVRPGDTVVIQGAKGSNGTVTATSVSDSGASATRGGASPTATGTTG
jgi:hypothetical protein